VDTLPAVIEVILPALNEEAAIPRVIATLPAGFRSIVVDNGSTDQTAACARSLGAVVVHEPRRGFGAACYAGLRAARSEVVCFMDCDGSLDGADLLRVARPIVDDEADLVLGSRQAVDRTAWPLHARLANRALAQLVAHRTGVELSDLGPMRAARRAPLLSLQIRDRRFGWPLEMILRAASARWRLEELPVSYQARVGRSKVTGTLKGTALTVLDMTRAFA
jgi:glycosyltransferase involved in cell wall biosynthesis